MQLEDLKPNASVRGILPDSLVTVVNVKLYGDDALELTYKTATGKVENRLVYREDEARLEVVKLGRPWTLTAMGLYYAWSPRRSTSVWRTSSTRCWRFTLL